MLSAGAWSQAFAAFDRVMARFMQGDHEDDVKRRHNTFKLIPRVTKGSWVIRNAVGSTPVLLGKKLTTKYFRYRSPPAFLSSKCKKSHACLISNLSHVSIVTLTAQQQVRLLLLWVVSVCSVVMKRVLFIFAAKKAHAGSSLLKTIAKHSRHWPPSYMCMQLGWG